MCDLSECPNEDFNWQPSNFKSQTLLMQLTFSMILFMISHEY